MSVLEIYNFRSGSTLIQPFYPATGWASLNGGTTGGGSAAATTVSDYDSLVAAVTGSEPNVVIISGPITQEAAQVKIGSNTTLVGASSSVVLTGFGLLVRNDNNVIIRNIAIAKVTAANGDAIGVQYASNIWIDHMDLSADTTHDKDFYDGLCDLTRQADFITVSNSYIHHHWKGSLIGHSDSNGAEDTGHLRVTQNNNHWKNIHSRTPSIRFGQAHIYNSYFEATTDGINVRQGAEVLVESNAFDGTTKPLFTVDTGGAVEKDNVWGAGTNTVPAGKLSSVEYQYDLLGSGAVIAAVVGHSGNTLSFAGAGGDAAPAAPAAPSITATGTAPLAPAPTGGSGGSGGSGGDEAEETSAPTATGSKKSGGKKTASAKAAKKTRA
ncbi:polysaccharide lyase family 1 protein [Cadophora sp. DSE1049]|nr:polysaccharide lyase family 1 protein [Cadophora sp. DSE1049]